MNNFRKMLTICCFSCCSIVGLIVGSTTFSPASSATENDKLTLLLDWFVNPDHAPIFVAQEKGFFDKRGLDVEIIAPSNPNDPPKLVAAGKADLAVSYQHQLHMQIDQGLPLVRIATLVGTPLNSLVVLEDGDIETLADLEGKTVGYSVGGFETVLLETMLEQSGLQLDDITMINVNFSLSPSLLSGQADAVIGAFRNFELNQMDIN
ncbi:MAG: ABC transporter substrate-binding protein, partial [Desulfopila sp.]